MPAAKPLTAPAGGVRTSGAASARSGAGRGDLPGRDPGGRSRPVVVRGVLAAVTAVAIALRLYQMARPGRLLGVDEYDDGVYFGSAVLLVHGSLPYRDYIIVQPPGITVLMAPVAALTKGFGTAWGMGVGRILTAVAGGAAAGLGGLLVRHRGVLAVVVTSGIIAVFPSSVLSARTLLLEPWLVLFCLLGALAVFDGDRLAGVRRLAWGGAAFGFAGAVKLWAIVPVVVVLVLILAARQTRGALSYLAGVAVGFLGPVLPFAALAPRTFCQAVVVSQLERTAPARTAISDRLHQMTGLTDFSGLGPVPIILAALSIPALVTGMCVVTHRRTGHGPPLVEKFAYGAGVLTAVAFLWPAEFYYHYAGFLAPFLAMAVALPLARLVDSRAPVAGRRSDAWGRRPTTWAVPASAAALLVLALVQARSESSPDGPMPSTTPVLSAGVVSEARSAIPSGGCLLTDEVSYAVATDRLVSSVPGCVLVVDGVGSDLALSGGRTAANGAQGAPAVRALWLSALRHAQYLWLSPRSSKRIPWTAQPVSRYFEQHFAPSRGGPSGLYVRSPPG